MRFLLAPFLALASLFAGHAPKTVHTVSASIVRLEGETEVMTMRGPQMANTVCTGFVVAVHRVLTANHCLDDNLRVDGALPKVLKTDEYYDLALLDVDTNKPAIEFRDAPMLEDETLIGIGYANGYPFLTNIKVRVIFADKTVEPDHPPILLMQSEFIGGMSGGPIIDTAGKVVSIVQRGDAGVSFSIGMVLIRAFLLGA